MIVPAIKLGQTRPASASPESVTLE
jgi:hypothetical protein